MPRRYVLVVQDIGGWKAGVSEQLGRQRWTN